MFATLKQCSVQAISYWEFKTTDMVIDQDGMAHYTPPHKDLLFENSTFVAFHSLSVA